MEYNPSTLEKKWQQRWEDSKSYTVDLHNKKKVKYYSLVMFPYPSGDKLHVGHWYNFGPADSFARFMRMRGYNVFEPMGYDSFGLPAENYAIKTGVPPKESTEKNIEYMRKQLKAMGAMYDWSKEVTTSVPAYYKWTQWVFLTLYKKRLAYKKDAPVNWCSHCQTVLANEQVKEGMCERCDTEVTQKNLTQWFFNIRDYAEDFLKFDGLTWPEKTMIMQKNWIGKSAGVTYRQKVKDFDIEFDSYDSVPQTFMAQTFAVIAPEHPLLQRLVAGTEHEKPVMKFVEDLKRRKRADKFKIEKEVEGIFTGRYLDNPFGTGDLPIWVASFVLYEYGSGMVNASAHDERDFAFAKKYDIPLRAVMIPADPDRAAQVRGLELCYHHDYEGIIQEPVDFRGRKWGEVREDVIRYIEKKGFGKRTINYKLRDWLISRQRYWGAPIPIINCEKCGEVPVPEKDLPVLLPDKNVDYLPQGKPPLASVPEFLNTKCPTCGGPAEREVETMDTFVDSSWYFLRYLSPDNDISAFDPKLVKQWMPVDMYIGGPEHACMHLLYARFIHKVLMDDRTAEPFERLVHQGLITKDGAKMSKSKGNVVSPDNFVEKYGSDVFRMYLMFMGPFASGGDWNDRGITGVARFVGRLWRMFHAEDVVEDSLEIQRILNKTIQKVTEDIQKLQFNTALAALMEFNNVALKNNTVSRTTKKIIAQLIAPLAPHFAEEVWEHLGGTFSIFDSAWPEADKRYLKEETVIFAIQVNGKLRSHMEASRKLGKEDAVEQAKKDKNVERHLAGKRIAKVIFVPGKIINFVVSD
ncbi:MAG: Leucine-tRNA ligase [Candidatus Peregrinibacteria bacterium GW2011_GWA2_47_7]|nr:MAG: Leucine-tRNA ligase [Candidatus Peregrinibacteria bacterium GW2011_GWA2_47_7]